MYSLFSQFANYAKGDGGSSTLGETASIIRLVIPQILITQIGKSYYKIYGSVGRIRLAEIPWVAVLDKRVTTSTQRGFYVQYLYNHNKTSVSLCVSVGWLSHYYPHNNTDIAKQESSKIIDLIQPFFINVPDFYSGPVDLQAVGSLARGYEHNTISYKTYHLDQPVSDQSMLLDLNAILAAYQQCIISLGYADPVSPLKYP